MENALLGRRRQMKEMRVNEWKTVWNKSSVERELNQIRFESYANDFKKIFKKGDLVLEAGCGYGRYCFWLEKRGVQSVGIDFVSSALRTGKRYFKSKGSDFPLILTDVSKLPFRGDIFDGYISLGVIEHFETDSELRKCLQDTFRVVKPKGLVYISAPNPYSLHMMLRRFLLPHVFFTYYERPRYKKNLRELSEGANFKILTIYSRDFYYPFYAIITFLSKRDIWKLKAFMRKILNPLENMPLLRNFNSGLYLILQKP
jgi:ubiquinone/menaquinone biosynthesis C-methylase UbiE